MSNEELEDDVVLAKFINYMQKALYHMRLNYFRDYERMRDYEVELEEIECPNSKDVINEDISIIGVLNDTEIKLLNLLYTQGLSYKEISEITNENIETLKMLEGYIDIYLPDLKYYYDELATKYSKAPNYFEIATTAILEMIKQVGKPEFDEKGLIKKGVIVRHLVLPNYIQNSKHILKWLKENVETKAYVSVMAQYFPTYKAKEDEKINRKLTKKEYSEIEKYLYLLNIENGYMQDLGKHEEEYVPEF